MVRKKHSPKEEHSVEKKKRISKKNWAIEKEKNKTQWKEYEHWLWTQNHLFSFLFVFTTP
jgi:hypothetical protein